MISGRRITIALVGLILLAAVGWLVQDLTGAATHAGTSNRALVVPAVPGADSGLMVLPMSTLPTQVAHTYQLIEAGGPFPYPRDDGVVFGNRQRSLPVESANYYHEYTVPTPGAPDRGARRLVMGSGHELYYTADHYTSFVVVDPRR